MSGDKLDATTLIVQRLGAIEGKLDENNSMTTDIRISVATQAETLKAQHDQLVEHIRRTKNLEERMKPIELHVTRLDGAIKFVAFVGLLASMMAALAKVFLGI